MLSTPSRLIWLNRGVMLYLLFAQARESRSLESCLLVLLILRRKTFLESGFALAYRVIICCLLSYVKLRRLLGPGVLQQVLGNVWIGAIDRHHWGALMVVFRDLPQRELVRLWSSDWHIDAGVCADPHRLCSLYAIDRDTLDIKEFEALTSFLLLRLLLFSL